MIPPDRVHPVKGSAALGAAYAACAAIAFWIAGSAANLEVPGQREAWHHYEYLAEGFAQGHTYLSIAPDPELLKLKDPYDPEANAHFRLWDASLYRGRFYLYFGPTPALFMAAGRIITGRMVPQRLAVGAFAAFGLAGLALFLRDMRRRHFPGLSPAALGGILLVALHASWLPVTLRRSSVWELPIVAAVAFVWWSVYLLWRYHDSGGRARWALAGGAALALLIGSRAIFLFGAGAISLLFLAPATRVEPRRRAFPWPATAASAILLAGGLGLLLYNHARFGSWLEFGQTYQLWGIDHWGESTRDLRLRFFSPAYFLFDARSYLLSAPRLGPYFPFLHPAWAEERPEGHMGFEEVYGVLIMMPVHLAGLAAAAWAWRRRAEAGMRPAVLALSSAFAASVLAGLVLFNWGGVCSRYITELVAGWTVATCVGLMSIFAGPQGFRAGRPVRILAAAAACWSCVAVWLASADYQGCMARANPRVYALLAHALNYPSQWWAREEGIRFGPLELAVRIPDSPAAASTVLVASGRPQWMNRLVANRVDRGHVQLALLENDRRVLETPVLPVSGGQLRIRLDAPWLYPPAAHPYWDGMEPGRARKLQDLFSIRWGSGGVAARLRSSVDPVALEPLVNLRPPDGPGSPYVESVNPTSPAP